VVTGRSAGRQRPNSRRLGEVLTEGSSYRRRAQRPSIATQASYCFIVGAIAGRSGRTLGGRGASVGGANSGAVNFGNEPGVTTSSCVWQRLLRPKVMRHRSYVWLTHPVSCAASSFHFSSQF
jgi:hypothetical protein